MKITKENILQESKIGNLEVLNHPSVDKVKDIHGWTPLHRLAWKGKAKLKDLKQKYPWFQFKKSQKVTDKLITKILITPQSVRFIKED